ncbi:MAG: 16S rRNA methyltransferase [Chloroflexota bacterium]|nr:16S rRNA methyltransferase [Chloroflexota bacterium]
MSGNERQLVVAAVSRSRRYRGVAPAVIERLATEELSRARTTADAIKRVKRRLHQSVRAYVPSAGGDLEASLAPLRDAVGRGPGDRALRAACAELLVRHASTRERLPHLDRFYLDVWELTGGAPQSLVDLGCGIGPLALPWMGLAPDAMHRAVDVDLAELALVDAFLGMVHQPHAVEARDLAAVVDPPFAAVDVALLLKLVPILDRQDAAAAARLVRGLDARNAVISFPGRSLGGRGKGMERGYRLRFETLMRDLGERVTAVAEASVSNELVFVVSLGPIRAKDG